MHILYVSGGGSSTTILYQVNFKNLNIISLFDSMDDEKDYTKNIIHERTTKSFTIDMNTLGMVKDYQEKYHRNNFSQVIDDLVNIGLANLGYKTQEDIDARFKGIDIDISPIDLPEPESLDVISTGFFDSSEERMKAITDIIKRLCDESPLGDAKRDDVISEAEIKGIPASQTYESLDRMKRNGMIYEPVHGKYRVSE